jgi:hypothetical protein
LAITDTGAAKGLLALAGFAEAEGESESNGTRERIYRENGRLVREQWNGDSSYGEYSVVLGERFTLELQGRADSLEDLKAALNDIDLAGIEALKDVGVARN